MIVDTSQVIEIERYTLNAGVNTCTNVQLFIGHLQIHDSRVQAPRRLPVSMLIPEKCNASHKLPTTPVLFPPIQITKTVRPGTNLLGENRKVSHQILANLMQQFICVVSG